MLNIFGKAALSAALAAAAALAATPAQARHRDHGDNDAAIAIGAGIVGLAIGAAIASDRGDRHYRDRYYYDRPRYRGSYYYESYPRYRAYRYDRRDYRYRDRYYDRRDRHYRRDRDYYGYRRR